ncbi:MAG: hypothetical protein WD403_15430 [Pirellulales bacterium]
MRLTVFVLVWTMSPRAGANRFQAWLLQELENEPDYWFWALEAITGENPVPDELRGNLEEMAVAWLEWGRVHGYLVGASDF